MLGLGVTDRRHRVMPKWRCGIAGLEVGSIPNRRPYHGTVFVLAELPELVQTDWSHPHPGT
jgi:hypothetical protein